jgi:F-type H+-transporting ATPase subunit epsilon
MRQVAKVEAEYVQIPSAEGMMGVLPNHAPLRCVLQPGIVTCRMADNSEELYTVSTGLATVRNNEVVVLADAAEKGDEIDLERAAAAKERAQQRLHTMDRSVDRDRAELALKRSLIRMSAAHKIQVH